MKVLHFILGKANKDRANGVNQVIAGLVKHLARNDAEVRVIGKAESAETEGELIQRDGFIVEVYSGFSAPLRAAIKNAIYWADIVHLHGVFSPWNLWVAKICNHLHKPFIITLHDGLAVERLQSGHIKKKLFHRFIQRRHLEQAAGIHILTEEEATDALSWFTPQYMFCINNGVDLDDYPATFPREINNGEKITIGYLGRVSAEKNIEALCKAVTLLRCNNNIQLDIAGPDSPYLQKMLTQYGNNGVKWVGPKYGVDKTQFIRKLDLFVHPSLCDVFSIAAMEVLAIGTPLLITRTAKASYFYDQRSFFMCEPTVFGLCRGVEQALARRGEWSQYSKHGRELVEKLLNWNVAGQKMVQMYEYILKGRPA